MAAHILARSVAILLLGGCAGLGGAPSTTPVQIPSEKESRTPAQKKIDTQLLYEIYRRRGETAQKHVPPGETGVKFDAAGRAKVDLRADVTPELEKKVTGLGSAIISTSVEYHSIVAWIPLLKLEQLAGDPAVHAIVHAAEATTNRPPKK